jgi:hypothetical protein
MRFPKYRSFSGIGTTYFETVQFGDFNTGSQLTAFSVEFFIKRIKRSCVLKKHNSS